MTRTLQTAETIATTWHLVCSQACAELAKNNKVHMFAPDAGHTF